MLSRRRSYLFYILGISDLQMQVVETTFLHCTFLVRILDVQLSHSVVTETQLSSLPIFSHLKVSMCNMAESGHIRPEML